MICTYMYCSPIKNVHVDANVEFIYLVVLYEPVNVHLSVIYYKRGVGVMIYIMYCCFCHMWVFITIVTCLYKKLLTRA